MVADEKDYQKQRILTEDEGSVQLTSLFKVVQINSLSYWNFFFTKQPILMRRLTVWAFPFSKGSLPEESMKGRASLKIPSFQFQLQQPRWGQAQGWVLYRQHLQGCVLGTQRDPTHLLLALRLQLLLREPLQEQGVFILLQHLNEFSEFFDSEF